VMRTCHTLFMEKLVISFTFLACTYGVCVYKDGDAQSLIDDAPSGQF
jgi:hypothetical protein